MRAEILAQLWPPLEQHLLPLLHQTADIDGVFPLTDWPDPSTNDSPSLRISDMFVRRYARPPKGSPGRRDRSLHRWSIPQHQDASELSVSIELSAPEGYEGGLYIGKRLGYNPAAGGWKTSPTLSPLTQGSAVVHRGNLTHGVTLKNGERWSLVVFFFRSCETQTEFFARAARVREQQRRARLGNKTDDEDGLFSTARGAVAAGKARVMELVADLQEAFKGLVAQVGGKTIARLSDPLLGVLGLLLAHVVVWYWVVGRRQFDVGDDGKLSTAEATEGPREKAE